MSAIEGWRNQKKTRNLFGKKGKIVTCTQIFVSAPEFKQYTPYPVALVKFSTGEKAYGQLVDYKKEDIKIGREVKAVLRILQSSGPEDIIKYGIKFRPV